MNNTVANNKTILLKFNDQRTLIRKSCNVYRHHRYNVIISIVTINLMAVGVWELAKFDARTPQQPRNPVQKAEQGFCHCILHLIMKEKHMLKIIHNLLLNR